MGAQAEALASHREAASTESKPKRRKKKQSSKPSTPKRRQSDQEETALRNEMLGIAISAVCLALMLALISYSPTDVGESGTAAQTGTTYNLIGPVGASIANILLSIFGLASFLIPITLSLPGICLLTGKPMKIRTADAIGYPIMVICCAIVSHLWLSARAVLGHVPGGFIGGHAAEIYPPPFLTPR